MNESKPEYIPRYIYRGGMEYNELPFDAKDFDRDEIETITEM